MDAPGTDPLRVILTTLPSGESAGALAREAVAAGMAACAQVEGPLRSHYRWEGEAREDEEWRVTLKVAAGAEPALREWALARHPYRTPQWVVLAAAASPAYLDWVRGNRS